MRSRMILNLYKYYCLPIVIRAQYSALISRWQVFIHALDRCIRAGRCGLAPVNKLKLLVAPNGPPLIMSLPRYSHPDPPYISNTFPRQCLRLGQVAKGRVVWDWFIQNRIVWGRVIKDRISPRRNFRGPNCNGSNCSEANCQKPSCPGPNIAERLHKAELSRAYSSEPSFPNTKYWKHISRKAVHVVILGVTIAYMRWCIHYEKKKIRNEKTYRYEFGKNILMN